MLYWDPEKQVRTEEPNSTVSGLVQGQNSAQNTNTKKENFHSFPINQTMGGVVELQIQMA